MTLPLAGLLQPSGAAGRSIISADCVHFDCSISSDGVQIDLSKAQTAALPEATAGGGKVGTTTYKPGTKYEYDTKFRCPSNFPGREEIPCGAAMQGCKNIENAGTGDVYRIWRRVDVDGKIRGPWDNVGTTCWPELVPGSHKPRLTLAMIEHEWSLTPFTKPQLSIQPVNNRTLVTLPTYFQLSWPTTGYEPGEERTVTLLGRTIKIRPTLKSNSYSFGDGTDSGPTTSLGGPWPTGDIRHAYNNPGSFRATVTTTYAGQYTLDGGAWTDLPGTTTITSPAEPLLVLTSTNHLY
ncbi:hypothetical protein V3G39_17210 [Dermatophilaceae bacterium Sec6.4]